ncbi:ATP-binding protein [Shewanella sp. NFH-SH190041]|uniref:ATP-binding protein n=1 Tax=Shewanella sp. NFH-SH190041 TaxID=2950245 RepID=UPI0021C30783|nr:ATP-binding protein [Shewanella sp. NFH-SH190041]
MERIKNIGPANAKPRTWEDIQAERREAEKSYAAEFDARYMQAKLQKLFGESGINQHFLSCTFDNFEVQLPEQQKALDYAKRYAELFADYASKGKGFMFSGTPGTGKNHLASAVANYLIAKNKPVVLLSVMDLLSRAKASYGKPGVTEERLLKEFCRPELLIIDEIGLQRGTQDELLWLTRIIDKRLYANRPTSFITNLGSKELRELLGDRSFDRIKDATAFFVPFHWMSHRGRMSA